MGNNQKLILLVGASGSGKTTIAKELEKLGYNIIHSYTTRERREPDEWGHRFTKSNKVECFIGEMIAYQQIYGVEYFATREQYMNKGTSIYVVDPKGAKDVKTNVKDAEVITIFLMADEITRNSRMLFNRNAGDTQERVERDREIFKTCKCDYVVDANREVEEVLKDIVEIIGE